ncbi:MAG: DUF1415 domain-containing protein [Methylococcales bacterium]|nr:DUF1415 domain-containing protein [Methylococcales bacterium]
MDNQDLQPLASTQAWLKSIIIGLSICPFAQREVERGSVRFSVNHDTDIEACLLDLLKECDRLNIDASIETTLLIYGAAFTAFDDYLDFLELAEAVLLDQDYEGVYQLASFHPDYCFEGAKQDDPANYTNRSPYPMLHLLRESSLERVIDGYPDTAAIPQRNIELTRGLGLAKMQALLAACHQA